MAPKDPLSPSAFIGLSLSALDLRGVAFKIQPDDLILLDATVLDADASFDEEWPDFMIPTGS